MVGAVMLCSFALAVLNTYVIAIVLSFSLLTVASLPFTVALIFLAKPNCDDTDITAVYVFPYSAFSAFGVHSIGISALPPSGTVTVAYSSKPCPDDGSVIVSSARLCKSLYSGVSVTSLFGMVKLIACEVFCSSVSSTPSAFHETKRLSSTSSAATETSLPFL